MPPRGQNHGSRPAARQTAAADEQRRAGPADRLRRLVRGFPPQYWLMVTGIFISNAGGSLVWPYLLIFASERLHLPLAAVGSLITIQAVAGMAASVVAGSLADRFGRKIVMVGSLAVSGSIYLLLSRADGYLTFALLMAVFGMGNPMYQVSADAMLADLIPSEQRAEAYAVNRIASNAGFGLGPAVGGFLATASYSLAFYGASAGFFVYSALVALLARETLHRRSADRADAVLEAQTEVMDPATPLAPAPREVAGPGFLSVVRDSRFVSFAALVSVGLIAPSTVWVLLAVYTKTNFGMPEYLYGWIPTTNAILCVTAQYPVTSVTRRFRPLPVIAVGMAVYAVGAGSVALMSSFPGFVLSMVVLTLGELIVVPTAAKYVADLAAPDLRGRYMSVYWLGWAAARAVAPLMGGFLNDRVGPVAIWYGALAVGLASSAGLSVLVLRTRSPGMGRTAVPNEAPSP